MNAAPQRFDVTNTPFPTPGSAERPGVLFLVNSLGVGGAEKQVVTLLNTLDTGRVRPSIAYLKAASPALLPQLRTDKLEAVISGDARGALDIDCIRRLADFVRQNDLQALVCTNTYSTFYGYLIRRFSRREVALISVYHTTVLRSLKEKLLMLLYRWVCKRCDVLVFVCENQRTYWEARGLRARRNEVIANGIDTAHFTDSYSPEVKREFRARAGFGPDDYVIGLCSALRPEKAHGDLLEAVAKLRAKAIPAKVLLIGEGAERERIERKARELGLQEHLHITGLQMDVRPWIACTDVMTLVSRAIETFSLAALESMALGKPLVMSDIGGASEQVVPGETGFLFPAGDADALVRHLTTLNDRTLSARMGVAAARRVRQLYTVEGMSSRFATLLDN
jgi:glycosyltransferase involved in cell wall biosynthesis